MGSGTESNAISLRRNVPNAIKSQPYINTSRCCGFLFEGKQEAMKGSGGAANGNSTSFMTKAGGRGFVSSFSVRTEWASRVTLKRYKNLMDPS